MDYYPLTKTGEPIGLAEYATKIVAMDSILGHVWFDWQSTTEGYPCEKEYIDP